MGKPASLKHLRVDEESIGHSIPFSFSVETPGLSKGGIAQLVERLLCKQNVIGSNPVTSTIFHE